MLRHSRDAVLVFLALLQVTLMGLTVYFFRQLNFFVLIVLAEIFALFICTNYQVIAHYFIHQKFFKSPMLNAGFASLNSLNLGVPSFLYHAHHVNHHQFNNGEGDRSSTFLFGKNGQPESLVRYSLLSPLRTPLLTLFRESSKFHSRGRQFIELIFFVAVLMMIGLWDPLALGYLLGVFYLGQVLAAAENYLEHLNAVPGDRLKNAVSCYSPWYNQIWFNNGYHQEHHLKPSVHWTLLPTVKSELPPEGERAVVQEAHWFFWRRA